MHKDLNKERKKDIKQDKKLIAKKMKKNPY